MEISLVGIVIIVAIFLIWFWNSLDRKSVV